MIPQPHEPPVNTDPAYGVITGLKAARRAILEDHTLEYDGVAFLRAFNANVDPQTKTAIRYEGSFFGFNPMFTHYLIAKSAEQNPDGGRFELTLEAGCKHADIWHMDLAKGRIYANRYWQPVASIGINYEGDDVNYKPRIPPDTRGRIAKILRKRTALSTPAVERFPLLFRRHGATITLNSHTRILKLDVEDKRLENIAQRLFHQVKSA